MDYLYPRLFRPLGIVNVKWQESPEGINCGGWGLYLKTEDLAKMGQLFLQKGKWDGQQVLPEEWIAEASAKQVASFPAGMDPEAAKKSKISENTNDWMQGYGYQRGCVKTLAQPFSIIYRPVIFSFVYAAFFSFIW